MKYLPKRYLFSIALGSMLSASGPVASALEVPALNDADVRQNNATFNYGGSPSICVWSTAGSQRYSYLQFKPEDYLPSGITSTEIAKATLKLYVNTMTTAGSVNFYKISASWIEGKGNADAAGTAISWNSPPSIGTTVEKTLTIGSSDQFEYVTVDVTALLKGWLDSPSTNYGLALKANGTVVVNFDAKEGGRSPILDVELTGIAGSDGTTFGAGSSVPANSVGYDGDLFLNSSNGQYYKKVSGVWTSQGSLVGPTGLPGTNGTNGTNGATGAPGPATVRIAEGGDLAMGADFKHGPLP